MTLATLGPVSRTIESDLRKKVQEKGLVIWLDADGRYRPFVDQLCAVRAATPDDVPYGVTAFAGSFLELMLALEDEATGLDAPALVVYLPGFNKDTARTSPLLELYAAGHVHERNLDSLITDAATGRVPPDEITAYLAGDTRSLDHADKWLHGLLNGRSGAFAARLEKTRPEAALDDLVQGTGLSGDLADPDSLAALLWQLESWTGLPAAWTAEVPRKRASDLAYVVASWALAVEYVHDLARDPVDPQLAAAADLPAAPVATCQALARHLRTRHPTFYRRTADDTQGRLQPEVDAATAADLGKIDTFRFEEKKILDGALDALAAEDFATAEAWAEPRATTTWFWLAETKDAPRRYAWRLILDAARLGVAINAAGPSLDGARTFEEVLDRYTTRGAAVDRAHRRLEQTRDELLHQVAEASLEARLRERLEVLRLAHGEWADAWATDFNGLCAEVGFLPMPALRQRHLFEEVALPLTKGRGAVTAFFMVDALRYEMATELLEMLDPQSGTTARLDARFAELPTNTEVGMNALAPVARAGKLHPTIKGNGVNGFSTGEFRVHDPETRRRAMHARVGGDTCPLLKLDEVIDRDVTSLKQAMARAKMLVVHSGEIDLAGEKGFGPHKFEHALTKLYAAWRRLRDAGVRHFVFTADHGYLLLNPAMGEKKVEHGRRIDTRRRHVFTTMAEDHEDEVRVGFDQLDYEGAEGYVLFPKTTAIFANPNSNESFAHGGNSLQERVIPVLTISHKSAAGSDALAYSAVAEAAPGVLGMHCFKATVAIETEQRALAFGAAERVALAVRGEGDEDVNVVLCDWRGATVERGVILAEVGEEFEVFFRVTAPQPKKVRLELYHPHAEVDFAKKTIKGWFDATAEATTRSEPAAPVEAPAEAPAPQRWLPDLPEALRPAFEHLARHGSLTENQAVDILGSGRSARRFAREIDTIELPFRVEVEFVNGIKHYLKKAI